MRSVIGEVTLRDVQIDPEFEARLRAPLKPIWQVVHREVLEELLACAATYYVFGEQDPAKAARVATLVREAKTGTLGVLTKERWEGDSNASNASI